ncbi:Dyp-type peroxidase [Mesorhizobium australicum]|uniref:Dyp-type peroxidase n=1 Tax=Mesorhizobium australicum TaxID=536018 RepID=UPI00333CEBD8
MSAIDLEFNEIQGNILGGFNTNVEVLIGLTADRSRTSDAARWLVDLAPDVTSVADVQEQRNAIKPLARGGRQLPITWLCVSVGSEYLGIVREDIFVRDEAFMGGFRKRAPTALGDRTDPNSWVVGSTGAPLDVFLIVASNDEPAAQQRADQLIASAAAKGLRPTYRETARRIDDLEHFGFRDGISQPAVRGFDANGDVGPGYFVFGYERDPGDGGYTPSGDPSNFLRNGSFLVFRRLSQDVRAFRDFCASKAASLVGDWTGLTGQHLEALLVGRWPSGALASSSIFSDPGRQPNENAFNFLDDMAGRNCPLGAHIRKVNPRDGPRDEVNVPRLLRRGIPFGPVVEEKPGADRGLAFISFQTSIKDQLEFLTGKWMNSRLRPGPDAGHDLLVGRSTTTRSLRISGPQGPVQVSDDGLQWIVPTGGGYLFAPGRSALRRMLDPLPAGVSWRLQKAVSLAVKGLFETLAIER